jgi:hypothetical protein
MGTQNTPGSESGEQQPPQVQSQPAVPELVSESTVPDAGMTVQGTPAVDASSAPSLPSQDNGFMPPNQNGTFAVMHQTVNGNEVQALPLGIMMPVNQQLPEPGQSNAQQAANGQSMTAGMVLYMLSREFF